MTEPVLTIVLAQPQEWLSLNKRHHWSRRSTLTRYWRQMAAATAPKARHGQEWPLPRCRVQVTYVVPDRRRRDVTNWSLTSKALVDGLVDCGVWPDDHAVDDIQARAAEVIEQATPADVPGYRMRYAEDAARALDEAGLLASPERDAAVAAKALRSASVEHETVNVHAGGGNLVTQVLVVRASTLRDRADRIERGAGERDE